MKKVIIIILIVIGIANIIKAEENKTDTLRKVKYGLKIGGTYSNVWAIKGEQFNADPKFGIVAGPFADIHIGKYVGIQTEILFSQRGFKATGTIPGNSYKFTRTTSFIDVPVLLTLKQNKILTFMAGPQYSYLIQQKDVYEYTNANGFKENKFKDDNVRTNSICFVGGFGFHLKHFVLGARVGWGILNNGGNEQSSNIRYNNVWYQVTIGYWIL